MNDHLRGLIITTLGVLFLVPDSLFVRLISADALAIAFWRGLFAGGFIAVFVFFRHGGHGFADVLRAGPKAWAYMVLYGISAPGFVLAISLTSVANVVLILASMPVFAAIFSRIFLQEPISVRMIWTMAGVFLGLCVILWGSHETQGASWQGDLVALGVSACFAAALTSARGIKARSMVPAVPIALIAGALLILPFSDVFVPFHVFWPYFLAHGAFIAVAAALMALGPRYLSSAEVSLLILLESVLAPLLVWYVIGEDPGRYALIGGAMVLGVLLLSNFAALRRRKA